MEKTQRIITTFFAHTRAKNATTDQDIIDAAASASDGNPDILADQMFDLADYKKIDITAVLERYRSATSAARSAAEKEKQKKDALAITENIKKHIEEVSSILATTDLNSSIVQEKWATINSLSASLNTTGLNKNIFPTLTDIYTEWNAYDPEKDFRSPLLAGTSIKDGTLSYIGARTNVGKTTALINITREALDAGRKVIFLTLEEPARDILRKLILCIVYANANQKDRETLKTIAKEKGDVTADFHAARKGGYVKGNKEPAMLFKQWVLQTQSKIAAFYGSRLIFCEGRSLETLEKTASAVTTHAGPGDIVLVDFVQRLKCPKGTDYTNYMRGKAQSEALFTIAKNSGAVVISGGQFNRATKDIPRELAPKGFKPFDETCFREAGDIEQDGDYIFGIGESFDTEAAKRYIKILKLRSGSGRGRCYAIDFQGAYNYMGIGDRLTEMNSAYTPKHNNKTPKQNGTQPPFNDNIERDWRVPDPDREPIPF